MKKKNSLSFRKGHEVPEEDLNENQYATSKDVDELIKLHKRSVFSKTKLCYAIIILVVAVVLPVTIYLTLYANSEQQESAPWTCFLKSSYRVACLKGRDEISQSFCESLGCCWNSSERSCYHSLPSQHSYSVKNWKDKTTTINEFQTTYLELAPQIEKSPYGSEKHRPIRSLVVSDTENHIRMFIYNPNDGEPILPQRNNIEDTNFETQVYGPDYFSVEIYRRNESNALLLSTARGALIATDNYWEIGLQFPIDGAVFGLGELILNSKTKILYNHEDRLSAIPFVIGLDSTGRAHGVLLNNAGPMEFEILDGSNLIIVRSLSNIMWDISIFFGPTPADVMEQYTAHGGRRPVLPPAWSLGLHICRDTEFDNGTAVLEELESFINQTAEINMPYETDCIQEKLLSDLTLNISEIMKPAVEYYIDTGKKLMLSLPPHVNSSLMSSEDLFVMNETGGAIFQDEYREMEVCFPDFFSDSTEAWLNEKLSQLNLSTGGALYGYVLQDNWPAVNYTATQVENMDYVPEGSLSNGTLWWLARHKDIPHYLVHNEYGLQQSKRIASGLQEEHLLLNAATFTGSGAVGGSHAHRKSEIGCTWANMKIALKTALGLGLAGVPLAGGGSICGSVGEYEDELCLRWYLMSSMLPLMRVSSELPLRDPVNLSSGFTRNAVLRALEMRYELLAYFYSLLYEASITGVPVIRPMFFEFSFDKKTWELNEQFMVGDALLVRPAFVVHEVSVLVYLPEENCTWYHLKGGLKVNNGTGGQEIPIQITATEQVTLLRGGFILPTQEASTDVENTLGTGVYNLVVGLNCDDNETCSASGDLQVNSNINFTFVSSETELVILSNCDPSARIMSLETVSVYGLNITSDDQISVQTNSCTTPSQPLVNITEDNQVLIITNLKLDICCIDTTYIQWIVN